MTWVAGLAVRACARCRVRRPDEALREQEVGARRWLASSMTWVWGAVRAAEGCRARASTRCVRSCCGELNSRIAPMRDVAQRDREPGERERRDETTAAPTESIARTTITCQLMAFSVVSCAAVAVAVADHCALDQRSDQRERRLASTRSSTRRIERSTSELAAETRVCLSRWYPSW